MFREKYHVGVRISVANYVFDETKGKPEAREILLSRRFARKCHRATEAHKRIGVQADARHAIYVLGPQEVRQTYVKYIDGIV